MEKQKQISEEGVLRMHSTEFLETLKKWLAIFGQHYQIAIDEVNAVAYRQGLLDLTAAELDRACGKCLRECEFIPKVIDIRKASDELSGKISEEAAAQAMALKLYDKAMNWLRKTDGGQKNAEELPPVVEFAMKRAGGRDAMLSGVDADREWARKHFVETYAEVFLTLKRAGITTRERAREALGLMPTGSLFPPALTVPQDTAKQA